MKGEATEVQSIEDEVIDERIKGIPGGTPPFRLGEIGAKGWNVLDEDLPLPLLILKRPNLEHNIALMQEYTRGHHVKLAPHGKTTMAPQIFKAQLDAGAWGITAASVEQLQVYRHYDVRRIILANQLVGGPNIDYICGELLADPEFEFYSFVDSTVLVQDLIDATEHRLGQPLRLLLEIGYPGGRTGVRSLEQAKEIQKLIATKPDQVSLAGVAGFEGLLPVIRNPVEQQDADAEVSIDSYLEDVAEAVDEFVSAGALPERFIVTAGGSAAFDKVVETFAGRWGSGAEIILRSGCYVTHDHVLYADSPLQNPDPEAGDEGKWLRPALELWSYVHSTPESGLALLTFGRRDVGFDHGLPVPLSVLPAGSRSLQPIEGWRIEALNDQHAYLRYPAGNVIKVGDRVQCGISHPCTTFDKWKVIPVVSDTYEVVGAIRTFF